MRFANRVVLVIDPKFPDDEERNNPDDPLSPLNISINRVIDYGRRSDLTEQEFMIALSMAPKGILQIDGEKVKFFREINQAQLSQYEQGYIDFKIRDQKYQNGKNEISNVINPPAPKLTPEEYEALSLENIRKDYHRFQSDGKVLATPVFYDLIKQAKGENVKLRFVENFLKTFVPEVGEGKLSVAGTALPKLIKKDAYLEFQNEMINNYVTYLKLDVTSEDVWMEHWKRLITKKKSCES